MFVMSFEVTEEMIGRLSPEGQVIVRMLLARIDELEAKLNKNSQNSSKPPSSAHPHAKPEPPKKKKSKRKRGGQPGHDKFQRELIPADECIKVVARKPTRCRGCRKMLKGSDKSPLRKQVHDVVITPIVRNQLAFCDFVASRRDNAVSFRPNSAGLPCAAHVITHDLCVPTFFP